MDVHSNAIRPGVILFQQFSYFSRNLSLINTMFCWFRFRSVFVKEAIHQVLVEELTGKDYNAEETTEWCRHLSDLIKTKLKGHCHFYLYLIH